MLYNIQDKQMTEKEVIEFMQNYKHDMAINKRSRYYEALKLIPQNKKVLDYGSGWGAFTKLIHEKKNDVLGIDQSDVAIEISNLVWGKELEFKQINISDIKSNSYDVVVSNTVVEHTHNPGMYLHQINRVLKENGLLIINLPNIMNPRFFLPLLAKNAKNKEHGLIELSKKTLQSYNKASDHIQGWDQLHFVRLVSSVGFLLKKYVPCEGVPLPRFKWLPPYIYPKNKRLKNFCYTMLFVFEKKKDSSIGCFD
ncbi:MAG: hypothetical protein B6247_18310 [Candidatus Parabeggiatoa sp. nov. 2]|nr:MAG: hypothetical protein B6247_18310 [Beggiatoa sp. 4572_84]